MFKTQQTCQKKFINFRLVCQKYFRLPLELESDSRQATWKTIDVFLVFLNVYGNYRYLWRQCKVKALWLHNCQLTFIQIRHTQVGTYCTFGNVENLCKQILEFLPYLDWIWICMDTKFYKQFYNKKYFNSYPDSGLYKRIMLHILIQQHYLEFLRYSRSAYNLMFSRSLLECGRANPLPRKLGKLRVHMQQPNLQHPIQT